MNVGNQSLPICTEDCLAMSLKTIENHSFLHFKDNTALLNREELHLKKSVIIKKIKEKSIVHANA